MSRAFAATQRREAWARRAAAGCVVSVTGAAVVAVAAAVGRDFCSLCSSRCANERREQRVRIEWLGLELRMELAAEETMDGGRLDDFT